MGSWPATLHLSSEFKGRIVGSENTQTQSSQACKINLKSIKVRLLVIVLSLADFDTNEGILQQIIVMFNNELCSLWRQTKLMIA